MTAIDVRGWRAMSGQRQFLGESPDERQARRRGLLLEAVLDQVAEGGLQSTSVRSVCNRAGLTSRYFYESFENLDELLGAALGSVADDMFSAGSEVMQDPTVPWRQRLRNGVDASIGVLLGDPRKATMMAALGAGDTALQRRRRDIVVKVATQVQADPAAANVPNEAASTLALFIAGGLVETTLAFLDGDLPITRDQLVDQLSEHVIGVASQTEARHQR